MKYFYSTLLAVSVGMITAPAYAQMWLSDRQATQGSGIRWGDIEIHPGVAAEIGYDSNYFARPTPTPATSQYPIVDIVKLRFTPQIYLSTISSQRQQSGGSPPSVTFSVGGSLMWNEFLTNVALAGRNREIDAQADGNITFAPGRPWSFAISDKMVRTAEPSIGPQIVTSLDRWDNRAAAELIYNRSGGLFSWTLGYAFDFVSFDNTQVQQLNNYRHEIYTRGRWRFFPRTAFIYDASVWIQQYDTTTPGLPSSDPVRIRLGLSGLLTDRFAITVLAGWGAGFYNLSPTIPSGPQGAQDFDSFIGQLELRYFFAGADGGGVSSQSSIAVGVTRDFQNGYMSYVQGFTKGYANANAMIAGKFYVSAEVALLYFENSAILVQENGGANPAGSIAYSGFNNTRLDVNLFAEYRIQDWLGFNATFQYTQLFANQQVSPEIIAGVNTAQNPVETLALAYTRWQLLGGARIFF